MSSQFKPWLLLAVIFIVGVLTGSALTIGLAPHFRHPPGAQQMRRLWMAQLVQRLNLTTDQQAKIQPIVADAETRIQSLHRDEVERGSQIFKAAHDQISALLTPGQQAELQKMESERKKRFSDHMRSWGPAHDGPRDMHHHDGSDDGRWPPDAPTNAAPPAPAPSP
jgi:Spy/CpxP family protein refolding chaperone